LNAQRKGTKEKGSTNTAPPLIRLAAALFVQCIRSEWSRLLVEEILLSICQYLQIFNLVYRADPETVILRKIGL